MIYALSKIDPKDLEILWTMRKQYLEKSPQVMEDKDLFPLTLTIWLYKCDFVVVSFFTRYN